MTTKTNGYLLHEDEQIVVIATGFKRKSSNPKTGDMIQVWILARGVNPVAAIKTGEDVAVCLDCKHRGTGGKGRTCYVRVANAPLGVWKAYQRGRYPMLAMADYARVFGGRKIRFGSYGEPVLVPLAIVRAIVAVADGHTGYTHAWANLAYAEYRAFLMASVDTPSEHDAAKLAGWRTFRVRGENSSLVAGEIMCPASEESGKRTTCENCKLCSGTSAAGDPRKDIAIIVHGSGARKFEQLIQIA
jgi:hypothetical protein